MNKLINKMIGLALIASNGALAGYPNYQPVFHVPQSSGGFSMGVTGLYLRTFETDGGLNIESQQFVNDSRLDARLIKFDPKYQWGYGVNIGYDISCSGNDVNLSYTHLNLSDHRTLDIGQSTADSFANFVFTNLDTPASALLPDFISRRKLQYHFNQMDFTVGRKYDDMSGHLRFHPMVGLRYAQVKHEFKSIGGGHLIVSMPPLPPSTLELDVDVKSNFHGIGPMVGLDGSYAWCYGFGVIGHFNSAILLGNVKPTSEILLGIGDPVNFDDSETFSGGSNHRVVTCIDGKLGINYSYNFCNKSRFTLEVGYQVSKYYDAIDIVRGDIVNPLLAGSTQKITATQTDDFDLNGPYISLIFHA